MADDVPSPIGEAFHWYGPKIIFAVCILSVSLQKHLFNIMNFAWIASHITCNFPLWLLYKFSCIHADICLHFDIFTYFLSGNAWHRLWMQRYCMTDKPPHIWLKATVTFLSGGHHPQDLTVYETDIYVRCLSTSTFLSVFYQIWMHNIIFYHYIYRCFIQMWYLSLN